MVAFVVPGVPVGKGRPRFSTRGGRPMAFTPEKTRNYEELVAAHAKAAMRGEPPRVGPVALVVCVHVPIPKSATKRFRTAISEGVQYPITKPDIDNYVKGICDGMSGIVFEDDSQVVECLVQKRYSDNPCVEVAARFL